MMDINAFRRLIAPLQRRVMLMVARALVKLSDDTNPVQSMQVSGLADETRDKVPRIQEYGFTSHPVDGAECVVLCLGGNRGNGVVIATDDGRYRLKNLKKGEVALYTDEGDFIHFKRGKIISVNAQSKIEITSPKLTLSGDLEVTGKVTAQGTVQGAEVQNILGTKLGTHMHPTSVPGPSSPPVPGS